MKKKYIITQGRTQSEWDGVDFALVEVTKELIEQVKQIEKILAKSSEVIDSVGVLADNANFFIDESELPERLNLEIEDSTCLVIELSDEEYGKLSRTEQKLRGGEMKFYNSGCMVFSTSGKNTGEEYWCDVSINFIKNIKS